MSTGPGQGLGHVLPILGMSGSQAELQGYRQTRMANRKSRSSPEDNKDVWRKIVGGARKQRH